MTPEIIDLLSSSDSELPPPKTEAKYKRRAGKERRSPSPPPSDKPSYQPPVGNLKRKHNHGDDDTGEYASGIDKKRKLQLRGTEANMARVSLNPASHDSATRPILPTMSVLSSNSSINGPAGNNPRSGTSSSSSRPHLPTLNRPQSTTSSANDTAPAFLPHPFGAFRQISGSSPPSHETTVSLNEILQPKWLKLGVFCSFQWNTPWLFPKLMRGTNVRLVMQPPPGGRDEAENYRVGAAQQGNECGLNVSLTFSPMNTGTRLMHAKLMILKFVQDAATLGRALSGVSSGANNEFIRIVIPTANLVSYDWGESQPTMENSVFYVDIPKKTDDKGLQSNELTSFATELFRFCEQIGLEENMIKSLKNYDFSNTAHLAFVHSIGGSKQLMENQTGLFSLAKGVRDLGLASPSLPDCKTLPFEGRFINYAASSIGALTAIFLAQIYRCLHGHSPAERLPLLARSRRDVSPNPSKEDDDFEKRVLDHFQIVFPSLDTVRNSNNGENGARTVCFQREYYNRATFPSDCMVKYDAKKKRTLSHNKIILVSGKKIGSTESREDKTNFMYVGSHNLSESAWGVLVAGGTKTEPRIDISVKNWECGVLFRIGSKVDGVPSVPPPLQITQATTTTVAAVRPTSTTDTPPTTAAMCVSSSSPQLPEGGYRLGGSGQVQLNARGRPLGLLNMLSRNTPPPVEPKSETASGTTATATDIALAQDITEVVSEPTGVLVDGASLHTVPFNVPAPGMGRSGPWCSKRWGA